MNNKDKLKDFLDKKLNRKFNKPTNEWSEILQKIEQEQPSILSWWKRPSFIATGIISVCAIFLIFQGSILQSPELSYKEKISISSFLIDNQSYEVSEISTKEYTYLALID